MAALAAYRLLKSADPSLSPEQYADQVTEMVYDGHGNYAASNRPRYMRGDVAKVLTQFKIYSQMMTYTIYRNAYLAAKVTRLRSRRWAVCWVPTSSWLGLWAYHSRSPQLCTPLRRRPMTMTTAPARPHSAWAWRAAA